MASALDFLKPVLFEAQNNRDVGFRLCIQSRSQTGTPPETQKPHPTLITPCYVGEEGENGFNP